MQIQLSEEYARPRQTNLKLGFHGNSRVSCVVVLLWVLLILEKWSRWHNLPRGTTGQQNLLKRRYDYDNFKSHFHWARGYFVWIRIVIVCWSRRPLTAFNSWLTILQGESQLLWQLWLLISWTYVNISEYPFNHLITKVGDFVWDIKHHGTCKDAYENDKILFWLIFKFVHFLPKFENFKSIFTTLDKLLCGKIMILISIVV